MTVPHLPHKTGLKIWSAVDRDGCFVELSRSINFVPPEGYQKTYLVGYSCANFCTCFSLVITPRDRHNMAVSILFVCTATHVPRGRVQKAYLVGIAKSFADFCTCFSPVITPHNMSVSILFVCTATHVPWRRVQKAYLVGIAKSFADFCTCFSLVITPHNMSVSIFFVCTATHVPWRTGRTKVALVELPTVNMFGFFFCTPFPRRILEWSFVVPRSHFHLPKVFSNLVYLKEGDHWPSHTCHTKRTWKCDPRLTEMNAL